MAKYMIHACPKRMWYVEEFMIPSMLEQGISIDDITVFNDTEKLGNLEACLQSFDSVPDDKDGIWHLQDDVLISSTFKEQTEKHDEGVVYGFSGYYDCYDFNNAKVYYKPGYMSPSEMWSSFQCVRIPNKTAKAFVRWYRSYMQHNPVYREYVKTGKCDDWFFKMYCREKLKTEKILNLAPNIVEHVDQLIGGSVINEGREDPEYRARFWEEPERYEALKESLTKRKCIV